MKKKRSIFWNTTLIFLPVILLADMLVLMSAYRFVSSSTYRHFTDEIKRAAAVADRITAGSDLTDPEEAKTYALVLNDLCQAMDIPYIYVLAIDEEAQSETYLAYGTGKDAAREFVDTIRIGHVVTGLLNEEQIAASKGDKKAHILHEETALDNTLICYIPRSRQGVSHQIIGAEKSIRSIVSELRRQFNLTVVLVVLLSSAFVLVFAVVLHHNVSKPAVMISDKMSRFVRDREKGFEKLAVDGSKEFCDMADAFNAMSDDINQYIADIDSLSREKHTREAELNIAKNIQLGLLPPDSFRGGGISVSAYMLPAKEVGGDLYYYSVNDNGETYIAIADVSGKGVSAALFMSRAVTLLGEYAGHRLSPSCAVETFNNTLAAHNPNGLFITAFVAVFAPQTRTLTYTNAGHNPPYLISDSLVTLDGAHGMAAGIFPGVSYEECALTLEDGDMLFLFTDGINEAQNAEGDFFGTDALEAVLRRHVSGGRDKILADVLVSLNFFAGGAEQSDDMTMLLLDTGSAHFHRELKLTSDPRQLTLINDAIEEIPTLSPVEKYDLFLIAEEIFVNQCSYAYDGKEGGIVVIIDVSDQAAFTFIDGGHPYDPTIELLNIDEYDHEHARGGLGKFIAFQIADDYSYRYENGKNILRIVKSFDSLKK